LSPLSSKKLHESLRRIAKTKYRFLSSRKRVLKAVKEYYGKKAQILSAHRLAMNIGHKT
jgi:hypothetical protein